ncbi:GNAT family N-acetyltransferase [Allokutzneria oryzae]|uniref:GNAT family N-acetyltransferase n=1 Tax=Allokutzneria oryzae TaxID=1378989 RepID=A0ABV5ZWV2_9PSEU
MAEVQLHGMTDEEYVAFERETIASYAALSVESGKWAEELALGLAEAEHAKLLPDGPATPGHHLYTARDGNLVVGVLWIAERTDSSGRSAYVYDIRVKEPLRGKGYGEALMRAVEDKAHALCVEFVQLHVHGTNTVARSLYGKLGYDETSVVMTKRLS